MLEQTGIFQLLNAARLRTGDELAWREAFNTELKRKVIDLITQDQMISKGVDEDGDIIGRYSRATELISNGRKREGDPFTLKDSGEFHESIFIDVLNDSIIIDGDTAKMESEDWWTINNISSEKILGLTDENMDKLAEMVKERYIDQLTKLLYGLR